MFFKNFCYYFEVNTAAEQKQASLVTIFCFLKVLIALSPLLPPLPYHCSSVGTLRKMSMLLTMENIYASAAIPYDPQTCMLLTTNRLNFCV